MPSPAALPGVEDALTYLRGFQGGTRKKGEQYYSSGRVVALKPDRSPFSFNAEVRGSHVYDVRVWYTPEEGWDGECACPMTWDCKHIYAVMKALLAENSAARVAGLSSGAVTQKPIESSLEIELERAVNRPLAADEKRFVRRLREIYQLVKSRRSYWGWELAELGLKLPEENRWPGCLESEQKFWNYVAMHTVRKGGSLPQFMRPITNFEAIAAEIGAWERKLRVAEWQRILDQTSGLEVVSATSAPERYEIRARFGNKVVELEWRRPGADDFSRIKPMQARSLQNDLANFGAELSPEGMWLWDVFMGDHSVGLLEVEYANPYHLDRMSRLFRIPAMRPLLVNEDGVPFEWPEACLRWNLEPTDSPEGDYVIRLTREDGTPVPPIWMEIPGNPPLYVTKGAVFRGPSTPECLDAAKPNPIPAQALETKAGANLLMGLKIELPPRLKERVLTVPLDLVLSCQLVPSYAGSSTETCAISARAVSPDGAFEEAWNGHGWQGEMSLKAERRSKQIVVTDRSRLRDPSSLVGALGARWDGYAGVWNMRVSKKFPEQFVEWMRLLPSDVKLDLHGDLQSLTQHTVAGTLKLDVEEAGIDWFDLRVVLDVADTTLTPAEIKLLLNARGGFVRLKDKGWRRLQFNLNKEEDEQLARLGLNPRELTDEPQRLHALQLADTAAKKFLDEPQYEQITRRVGELKARVTPPVPATVRADLRPYQQEGFHFLAYLTENRFGGILADDMGLGKTLQTLTWLQWLRQSSAAPAGRQPSLVVCPKSVMDNWRAEAERFTSEIHVKVWSPDDMPTFWDRLKDFDLHVLNYNQLRGIGESLSKTQWLAVILDEGQYIKNPSSITAQIARSLRADHRLVLSGTPIENKLLDLWSLMAFAMPGVLGSRAQFAKLYDAKEDPFARRRLSARVRPFLLRRTKTQVAKDLPDRIEEDILCEIEGEQKTLYRAELKRAQQMLLRVQTQKQLAQERFHFLTSLLRLRQICCDPRLVKPDSKAASAKVEALVEQLEPLMEEGQKVLVFSQFVQMLDILRTEVSQREWQHFYLAGDTENRGELVAQFQNAEGPAVFLISLKAGGFGLNLTAASYVILFDPWWNPAVENQAIDRTHRIGQKQNVIAYRLLIKNSIEEKIRNLQKTKSALADDVLGEERFAQNLTLQDLHFLFSDD